MDQLDLHMETNDLTHTSYYIQKKKKKTINLMWIVKLNVKKKIKKLFGKNDGFLYDLEVGKDIKA